MDDLEFGLSLGLFPHGTPDARFLLDFGARAEFLGYDSVWLGDHMIMPSPILEPLSLISAWAGSTSRIMMGPGVLLLPLRHPTVVAKTTATIDYLTNGRFILGVGVGGEHPTEWAACGIPMNERGRRADEGIALIRQLWSGDKITFQGRYYQVEDAYIKPTPVRAGGPPIWIGGRSDAALRRTGRVGDAFFGYAFAPERFKSCLDKVKQFALGAGRDPSAITPAILVFSCVGDDRDAARRSAIGYLGGNYSQDFDKLVDRFVMYGPLDACVERLKAYVDAGARHIVFRSTVEPSQILQQAELYTRELIPAVRSALASRAAAD